MSFYSIAKTPTRQLTPGVFEVWKERAETLAALVQRFRNEEGIEKSVPITYAGRLDPMAEGIVILLVGDARFEKERYLSLEKEYEFEALIGVSTDSYDVLGLITDTGLSPGRGISREEVERALEEIAKTPLPYPPYSSKPIDGTPLFAHARAGKKVDAPLQKSMPLSIEMRSIRPVLLDALVASIISDIRDVEGDFRQEEITGKWRELEARYGTRYAPLATCTARVSSGVYIRSIAHALGQRLGTGAIAFRIIRTRIGNGGD